MTSNVLKKLLEIGVYKHFVDFTKNSEDLDYETLSFMLQLGCKISVMPNGMQTFLDSELIELGFRNILKRKFVLANNKRFAGSDSTNA